MKSIAVMILASVFALTSTVSNAEAISFETLKSEFAQTEKAPSPPVMLIPKDQTVFGSCFTRAKPEVAQSSALLLFAAVKPFARQPFVALATDFDPKKLSEIEPGDWDWTVENIKERESFPFVRINNQWSWLRCDGYIRTSIKFIEENKEIKSIVTRSECTGDERECRSCKIAMGEWEYCSFKPQS